MNVMVLRFYYNECIKMPNKIDFVLILNHQKIISNSDSYHVKLLG